MSDNVVPIFQHKKRNLVIRIVLLAVAVLLVLLLILLFALPDVFNLDGVKRYFKYLGDARRDGFGTIAFDADSSDSYGATQELLAVGTQGGLYLYDNNGTQKALIQGTLPNPTVRTNGSYTLCFGTGGSFLAVADRNGRTLLTKTVDGTILDAQISADGYVCILATAEGYKSVATVIDPKQQEVFRWYSSTQYLNCCAVSADGTYLAVAGLGQSDSVFYSSVTLLRSDSEQPLATVQLGNQLLYALHFSDSDALVCVGQDATTFLSTDGETLAQLPYDGRRLTQFSFAERFTALALNETGAGGGCTLLTLDGAGETLAEKTLVTQVQSICASGRYLSVLTGSNLLIYTSKLKDYAQTAGVGSAFTTLMRGDGTALQVGAGEASLFLP